MKPNLTHVALHVSDIEKSIVFYKTYCELHITHDRTDSHGGRVVWMGEEGREHELIFVMISGGPKREVLDRDFAHLGFALESREAIDRIASRGRAGGCLAWEPVREPYPVGYYCGLRDPDGQVIEFSYGQPLGPGSE